MLKTLRENVRHFHWVLWVVIAAFIALVFVDIGYIDPASPTATAATVGDAEVTFGEVESTFRNLESRYRQMFGDQWTSEMAEQFGVHRQALEQAINRRVLMVEAERLGLRVSDDELREAILDIPGLKDADGRYVGHESYERWAARLGYSIEGFESLLREDLLGAKISQVMAQTVWLSDSDLEQAYREQVEKASIRYLQMPAARFADQVETSGEELAAYLAAHAEQYRLPEQREVAYLLVDRNLLRDRIEIPDADLRAHYEDNGEQFESAEQVQARHVLLRSTEGTSNDELRARLEQVRGRIAGGEDFAAVAREVSEDPGSAQRGGDLGFFGRGQMVPEFEQAAFGAEPGALVGPIETQFGLHLIEVTARRDAGRSPYEEVREQIRFQLAQERVGDLARERAVELAAEVGTGAGGAGVDAMRPLADADQAVFFYEPPPFGANEAVVGLGRSPAFTGAAFELAAGELSAPVEVPRGWAVIYVEQTREARDAELAEVEPRVRRAVAGEKSKQAAVEALAAARRRLDEGAGLDEVAADLGLEVAESGEFGSQGTVGGLGLAPRVARAAMELDEGELGGPFETTQGAVVFEVATRQRFERTEFEQQRDQLRQQVAAQRAQSMQGALIQQRRDELGVSYSRQVIDDLGLEPGAEAGGAAGG